MADAPQNFDQGQAQAAVNAEKGQMLTMLAQGGTRAVQDHQASVASVQQQAVANLAAQSANAQGSAVQGSAAFAGQMAGQANSQAAYQQQQLGSQLATQQQFNSNLTSANSNYMDQLNAAVPLAHEDTQRRLDAIKGAADEHDADRAFQSQMKQFSLKEAQMRLEQAAQANSKDPLDEEYKRLRNAGLQAQLDNKGEPTKLQQEQLDQSAFDELMGNARGPKAQTAIRNALNFGKGDQNATMSALSAIVNGGVEGIDQVTTPRGGKLSEAYLTTILRNYYKKRLGLAGDAVPAPVDHAQAQYGPRLFGLNAG